MNRRAFIFAAAVFFVTGVASYWLFHFPARTSVSVFFGGSGTGSVTAPGLLCASDCITGDFYQGSKITLTATPIDGSFAGWGGPSCSGTSPTCDVTLGASNSVIAYFRSSSRKVAAGESHSCALQPAGNVVCWGLNTNGQLGTGDTSSMGSVTGITNAVAIAAGGYHTCALIGGGTVQCWGRNNHGQVGVIFGDDVGTPTNVPGITEAVAVTAGGWHTCAVKAGGTAFCWGHNANGQLGDGTTNDRFGPVGVDLSAVGPLTHQIAAGGFHTCAIVAADSTVACWGMNNDGQLGYPYSTPSDPIEATPGARVQKEDPGCGGDPTVGCAPIAKPTLLTAQTIAASIGVGQIGIPTYGGFHTVAIDTIGQDWSWGNNNDGQLTSPSGARKQAVQGTFSGVTKIAAGAYHTCIVKSIAGVFCRGNNDHQQSGPAAGVPSTLGSLDVAAGGYHTCAVIGTTFGFSSDPAGSVACWGEDNNGQVTGVPGGGNVTTPAFLTLP